MRISHYLTFRIKKWEIYLSIIFLQFFYFNSSAQPIQKSKWIQIPTPIYSDINNLILFSPTSSIASGKEILILDNGSWHKMDHQPPSDVNLINAFGLKSIFISTNTEYQESKMYYWNGSNWISIQHPLANTIAAMEFKDKNNGIICGFGEIAILKNKNWSFLPPPTNNYINAICTQNDSIIWALSPPNGLFRFDGKWHKIIQSKSVRLIKLFENDLYVIGKNFYGVVKSDSIQIISRNNKLNKVTSFSIINEKEIFACGLHGTILKYENNQWAKIENKLIINFKSINMLNNKDGWIVGDEGTILHYTNQSSQNIIKNLWKGFEKITFYAHAKVVDDEYGVVAADFNGDGRTDIFTCGLYENNHLYVNQGSIHFLDEGEERGVSGEKFAENHNHELNLGACAGDFDNDGHIDLYVSSLTSTNKIYHNLGGGDFVDYSDIADGIGKTSDRTNTVISGDADNDGDLDLFLCNENTTNRFFENNGAGIFTEITSEINLISEYGGMGASFSDIDSDGDIDLFVANWSAKNKLYKNLFAETGKLKFIDFTDSSGVGGEIYTKSNGVVFADIDNDADVDLFVTNRKTSNQLFLNNGYGYFTDVTSEFIGIDSLKSYGAVIFDFNNDGYKDLYISNVGENKLFLNVNGTKFIDQTNLYEAGIKGYSTGLAAADYNNDNNIDLYVANYIGTSSAVLKNKPSSSKSVTIKLVGIKNNASSIGAKIYAYRSGHLDESKHLISFTEVSGGSGYGSMNSLEQIIPCLSNKQIEVKVIFPSGNIVVRNFILAGSKVTINDVAGKDKRFALAKKYFTRLFFDPHRLFLLVKWILVLSLLVFSGYLGRKKYNWSAKIILSTSLGFLLIFFILQTIFEYDKIFFSTFLPVSSMFVLLTFLHLSFERIKLKQETEIEKQILREKLSRDLHDDLASTLGTVTIYLELLKGAIKNNSNEIWTFFNKSENLLINAKNTVTDLIWTIKPKPEKVTDFATKLRENFLHPFKKNNIRFFVKENNLDEKLFLNPVEKHNIYLIIKESLNNILKYASATEVEIEINREKNSLFFSISDNGIGFDTENLEHVGNGLDNIKKRAKEMNANFSIESNFGKGTKILIELI